MAIDCGAERSGSFGVVIESFVDFTFVVGIDVVDLFNALIRGIFFVGRFGVASCSDGFRFLSSCSLLAAAAF